MLGCTVESRVQGDFAISGLGMYRVYVGCSRADHVLDFSNHAGGLQFRSRRPLCSLFKEASWGLYRGYKLYIEVLGFGVWWSWARSDFRAPCMERAHV